LKHKEPRVLPVKIPYPNFHASKTGFTGRESVELRTIIYETVESAGRYFFSPGVATTGLLDTTNSRE